MSTIKTKLTQITSKLPDAVALVRRAPSKLLVVVAVLGAGAVGAAGYLAIANQQPAQPPPFTSLESANPTPNPAPAAPIPQLVTPSPVPASPVPKGPGVNYFVSPAGRDTASGRTASAAFGTPQRALDAAQAGDTITLAAATYSQDAVTRRPGTAAAPITITGPAGAVIKGGGGARILEINHDYISLSGFTIDGRHGSGTAATDFRDKLIYVQGKQVRSGLTGLNITSLTLTNAGGECLRLRYFVRRSEISHNHITNCGVHDFQFGGGGKNGEGIYVGTAPEQTGDGKSPTPDVDQSNGNWIHHNRFDTQGNECVDIKEGASGNLVEHNSCTGQRDSNSGGLDARGSGNIFRHNNIFGNVGAGVRLGGDSPGDGTGNQVYANTITGNQSGGIKVMRSPQAKICGNHMSGNQKGSAVGKYAEQFRPADPCS